ncbi:MAG: hypothetical protein HEQ24_12385 [Dolichospermum sp. BR01]|nr:hypothetical protein [Dolichospermum sp. BR01]
MPVHVKIGVRSQESGVRSQESGVRSQESGVRSQESGVRSQEKKEKKEKKEKEEESIFYSYILHLNIYQVLTLTLQVFHFLLYI